MVSDLRPGYSRRFHLCWRALEMREQRTVTLKGLAKRVAMIQRKPAVSHSTISRYGSATRLPSPEMNTALAVVFSARLAVPVDPGWLLYGAGTAAPPPMFVQYMELRPAPAHRFQRAPERHRARAISGAAARQ